MFERALRRAAATALLSALVSVAALSDSPKQSADTAWNVVLLTLDTTRADHLGCYGYKAARTPVLDRLAREGVKFESAFSPVPNTLPSHATILTGLYPYHTGVRDNLLYKLPDSALSLAEILKSRGYQTLAFISAAVLDRSFGLNQGFDVYDDRIGGAEGAAILYDERNAAAVNLALQQQLPRIRPPFFLWMHYYDPHEPYAAPAPFGKDPHLEPYDAEVAYMDQEIGKMLQQLSSRKLLENTLIVVVGDHGESLGEHGEKTHGIFLYDSVLRVPLILWAQHRMQPAVVRGMVRTVDVTPTILDYLGIHAGEAMDGVSLRKSISSGQSAIDTMYQETFLPRNHFGWSALFGFRTPRWHFILAPRKEFYDVEADPAESRNSIDEYHTNAQELERRLREIPFAPKTAEPPTLSPELKEKIASLGYVSSDRTARSATGMDPKDGILLLNRVDAALDLLKQNRTQEAAGILQDVLRQNPQNVPARVTLGRIYLGQRNYDGAQRELAAALQYSPLDTIHLDLALALVGLGRFQEAADQYRLAISMNPRQLRAYVSWAELELRQERVTEADTILKQADEADVHGVELTLLRGRIAAFHGNWEEAIRYFQQARDEDSANPVAALYFLGNALEQAGKLDEAAGALKQLLEKDPVHAGALRVLGDIYFKKQEAQPAIEYYERYLRVVPNDRDAEMLRERIRSLSTPRP